MSLYCIAEIISTVPRWFVFYSLCKLTHVVAIFSEKKKPSTMVAITACTINWRETKYVSALLNNVICLL